MDWKVPEIIDFQRNLWFPFVPFVLRGFRLTPSFDIFIFNTVFVGGRGENPSKKDNIFDYESIFPKDSCYNNTL